MEADTPPKVLYKKDKVSKSDVEMIELYRHHWTVFGTLLSEGIGEFTVVSAEGHKYNRGETSTLVHAVVAEMQKGRHTLQIQ